MRKPATVYDVAERAGVSIATVSFAFRRPEKVRPETREIVLAAARDLGYVPSASARGLARGRTTTLGLLSYGYLVDAEATTAGTTPARALPWDGDDEFREFPLYIDEIQRGMELQCWQNGYALMVGGADLRDPSLPVTDIAGRVDGLAVFPQSLDPQTLRHIAGRIAVVAVSEPPDHDGLSHITVDNRGGTRAVTEHLIATHGLRDLIFFGDLNPSEARARFAGFTDALRDAGLPAPDGPVIPRLFARDGRLTFELPDDLPLPQGFVCATDDVALTVMQRLAERGVRVPHDVAVTGFDGIAAGRMARPSLTTVRQPMVQIGKEVVDILIGRIADPAAPPVARELPVALVVRESCGCSLSA